MHFGQPLRVVGPAIDGDILTVVAAGDVGFTGREIARRAGTSQEGTRRALERLLRQGVLTRERAGHAHLYRLNRDHLAARWIEALASVRRTLFEELRRLIGRWEISPHTAKVFGSVARGDADEDSDIDILLVRPRRIRAEDSRWVAALDELRNKATAWTGNDTRILEYGEAEFARARQREPVLKAALSEGIELLESLT